MKRRGFTLVELMAVCAVLAVVTAVAVPSLLRSRIAANESSAITSLKTIQIGQEAFVAACHADENANGVGEYGTLRELSGNALSRGRYGDCQLAPFLPRGFNEDVSSKSGYQMTVYICTNKKGTGATNTPRRCVKGAEYNEHNYMAYAWPEGYSRTGYRVFAVSAHGAIMACKNSTGKISGSALPNYKAAIDRNGPRNWNGSYVTAGNRGCMGKLKDDWVGID